MKFNIIGNEVCILADGEPDKDGAIVITEEIAKKISELLMRPKLGSVNIDYLIESVCTEFCVSRKEMITKTRKREVVIARYVVFYILYKTIGHLSLSTIGALFLKDHATVLHGIRQVDLILETKDIFYYDSVKKLLRNFVPKLTENNI